jgi:hypothetical protein
MAKKKSLFKKLRKSQNSVVAEPEAPVDEALLEELAKPKVEEVVKPTIVRKPYIAPPKTYPEVINIEVNKNDVFNALDLAKRAAIEDAGKAEYVGEFYSIDSDEERVATYLFEAKLPGYKGWRWAVTVAKIAESAPATICDIGIGDVVPTSPDDERLVPLNNALPGDEELDLAQLYEFGFGRARVLSIVGRDAASKRWYEGDRGPRAPIAAAAPKPCSSCGFFIPIAGSLRSTFGVCSNAISPEDARVVSVDHGCGAHSEVLIKAD